MKVMERAAVDGLELEYELHGAGEPVVLIHWGVSSTWAEPLLDQATLADRYRLLSYHRAGFGRSSGIDGTVGIADHARHCRLLMEHLGIDVAHVVGHSSSALIALQLALDFPDTVRTLVLMEPARPAPPTEQQLAFRREFAEGAAALYRAGDKTGAVDLWARGVFGPGYADRAERGLPGIIEQCVAEADAFFAQELPAVQQWAFTEEDARRIDVPVLAVVGERTIPTFPERIELLGGWLPRMELYELPGGTHLLHLEKPEAVAEALASFFGRHPMTGTT